MAQISELIQINRQPKVHNRSDLVGKVIRANGCEIVIVSKCTGILISDPHSKHNGRYMFQVSGNMNGNHIVLDVFNMEVIK